MTSKLLFLDSFVFIRIAEDPHFASIAKNYITSNQFTLIIGVMNLIEVYKWKRYWAEISEFIADVQFCIAQNPERIADVEVVNYPNNITLPTGFCSSDFSYSKAELIGEVETNLAGKISVFEKNYRNKYKDIWKSILDNRSSFPPDTKGKYSSSQRWLFLQTNVMRWLYPDHKSFLKDQVSQPTGIRIECFKSVLIQMLAIFLEYYVHKKDGKPSDLGDFYNLSVLPYVDLAVVDNERNDLIKKINRQILFTEKLSACNLSHFRGTIERWVSTTH